MRRTWASGRSDVGCRCAALVAAAGRAELVAGLVAGPAVAQEARGTLAAIGQPATLAHAYAHDFDSALERGYLDVVIVLSDRRLAPADTRDGDRLEPMARKGEVAALVVRQNPDAKVSSAAPLHRAFTTFIRAAAFVHREPSAFDEKRVAGRLHTSGTQDAFRQKRGYDVTFSAPVALDPAAQALPRK